MAVRASGVRSPHRRLLGWLPKQILFFEMQVHEATADLTANMNQEHCACMTYVRDSFGWVLTPYQASLAAGLV